MYRLTCHAAALRARAVIVQRPVAFTARTQNSSMLLLPGHVSASVALRKRGEIEERTQGDNGARVCVCVCPKSAGWRG